MSNQRFSITPSRAVSDQNMPDGVFRTLSALGIFGDKNGWCWPSLATLAKIRGLTKPAISQHAKWLKENKYLNVHARYNVEEGKANRRSNRYQIRFDYNDTEAEEVLSSELNTPLSSELNTVERSELNVNAPLNAPIEPPPSLKQKRKPIQVPGIMSAMMGDRPVTEEDMQADRQETIVSRLSGWPDDGILLIVLTFCEAYNKLPPSKPEEGAKNVDHYWEWRNGAETLQNIEGEGNLLHIIKMLGEKHDGFAGIVSPYSIRNQVFAEMNEAKAQSSDYEVDDDGMLKLE